MADMNDHFTPADSVDQLYSVGEAAELLAVSVRTLHHWDDCALLTPQMRSSAGYRLYSAADLQRGRQILIYRSAGLALGAIAAILREGGDEVAHLQHQKVLLTRQRRQIAAQLSAVNALLKEAEMSQPIDPTTAREIMGDHFNAEYQAEAEQRWGDTAEWAQSQQVLSTMTTQRWEQVAESQRKFVADLRSAYEDGIAVDSPRAAELVERHRADIGQWYTATLSRQVLLAQMYVADERFSEFYGTASDGTPLVGFLKDLIDNAARNAEIDVENCRWDD